MRMIVNLPAGTIPSLYPLLLSQHHLLIGGVPGAGKSVIINGMIAEIMYRHPCAAQMILLDPKLVELRKFAKLPHTRIYAAQPAEMIWALKDAVTVMDFRYRFMADHGMTMYDRDDLFVIIDELADLLLTQKKQAEPLIQRLAQLGRAAKVHVIAATQTIHSKILSGYVRVSFPSTVALRTRDALGSRMLMDVAGCENLPEYGQGYLITPSTRERITIDMVQPAEIQRLLDFWADPRNIISIEPDVEPTPENVKLTTHAEIKRDLIKRIFGH